MLAETGFACVQVALTMPAISGRESHIDVAQSKPIKSAAMNLRTKIACQEKFRPQIVIDEMYGARVRGREVVDGGGMPMLQRTNTLELFGMRVITVSGWDYSGEVFSRREPLPLFMLASLLKEQPRRLRRG